MTEQAIGTIPVFTTGDRLRKAREMVGLDQQPFADELGVSRGTVSNYERSTTEKRKPIVMRQWALATGVPLAWLETGEGAPTAPGPDGGPRQPSTESLNRAARRHRSRSASHGAPTGTNGQYAAA